MALARGRARGAVNEAFTAAREARALPNPDAATVLVKPQWTHLNTDGGGNIPYRRYFDMIFGKVMIESFWISWNDSHLNRRKQRKRRSAKAMRLI
jgi:hypothetical protein